MQNEIEIMRVIRVPPIGALVVHADGRRLKQISAVEDERQRQRLLAAIGELVGFAGGYDALVQAGVAPPLAASEPSPAPEKDLDEQLTKQQAAFLDHLERQARGNVEPEMHSSSAERGLGPPQVMLDEGTESGGALRVNLVAEIDAILQKHVAANELLAHRSIHLQQMPGEMLQIVVDNKVYEHPSEIEDDDVKQALKRALREWEAG